MTDTIPGETEPVLDQAGRIRLRADETYFRLIAPRHVGAFGIVQIGKFTPGSDGNYAVAAVIGVQTKSWGSERHREYSLHYLAYADDRGPDATDGPIWYLYNGLYDIPTLGRAQDLLAERER